MRVWIDGRRRRTLDVADRGLQYGDGLFETMHVCSGTVRLLELHLERLSVGLAALGIGLALTRLRAEIRAASRGTRKATLKLIVTRGAGQRGYRPQGNEVARRILMLLPAATFDPLPACLRMCSTRLATGSPVAGLKTLGRLESVLARREWRSERIFEGLMRDNEGRIVCGTMTNLFLRRGATLQTPAIERCGVAGVMRRWILEEAPALQITVKETQVSWNDLRRADEVFVSNALIGVRPVRAIEWRGVRSTLRYDSFDLAERLRARIEVL